MPLVVVATSGLLFAGAVLAAALHVPDTSRFAALVALAALVPWRGTPLLRRVGLVLAYAVVAWSVFGLAPFGAIVGKVPGPYGGHAAGFWVGGVAGLLRVAALSTEAVLLWTDSRWTHGVTAEPKSVGAALIAALSHRDDTWNDDVDCAVVSLAHFDRAAVPTNERDRRAFFIDVYNVVSMHARRDRTSRRAWSFAESFRVRYEILGTTLSLDEIEHNLLRGNRRHPMFLSFPFGDDDERSEWVVELDPRVHFALNCGMQSCPPVRGYSERDPEANLDLAASSFVASETKIDDSKKTVETSQLLQFYAADFGGEPGILRLVERYCERGAGELAGYSISYRTYDTRAALTFA